MFNLFRKLPALRIIVLGFAIFFISKPASAQDEAFPGYGRFSNAEIRMKQCAFDTEAVAVVLVDEAISSYDDDHHLITDHHKRIKILKEKGVNAANISIPYYTEDDFENISDVHGMTFNADAAGDGKTTAIDKSGIYKAKLNDKFDAIVFTFPDIKTGSIIDYCYKSTMKTYEGLNEWIFQQELPVLRSSYSLFIVPNTAFSYLVRKIEELPVKINPDPTQGKVFFEMKNIPGLGEEPFMDARQDYLQKVSFQLSGYSNHGRNAMQQYMNNWDEVAAELMDFKGFGSQLYKNIPGTEEITGKAALVTSQTDKMKLIYNYVRSNMNWNGIYEKATLEGVKNAWQKRNGTSGEINMILINLLKEAGLEVFPMLVSSRSIGKIDPQYPFLEQFKSVNAFVTINGKNYYLDATDKYNLAGLIPYDILNTKALLVKKRSGRIIDIADESLAYLETAVGIASVDDNFNVTGEARIESRDYAKIKKTEKYAGGKEQFTNEYLKTGGISITDLAVENMNSDSLALLQNIKFSVALKGTGDYKFLPLNLFLGYEENPFTGNNRFSNINFGFKRNTGINLTFRLPAGVVVESLPDAVLLKSQDGSILFQRTVNYQKEDNTISCIMNIEFKKSLYTADEYPALKRFYKKMFEMLKEPVVLKK